MKLKKILTIISGIAGIIVLFYIIRSIPSDSMHSIGAKLPLPIFTFVIALIDGFNPCNVFMLALFLSFLISASQSRRKVLMVGYTFVIITFILYYIFMAAWLNLFEYMGFVTPLRIIIGLLSVIVGIINCKEMFFFKKGISLTVQDNHKNMVYQKLRNMRKLMETGSTLVMFISAVMFTLFVAMIELPCTAGFPIVYTGVLAGKYMASGYVYYLYLLYYNIIFILPAAAIVAIFGICLKSNQIQLWHVKLLKFIGGIVLLVIGAILLINPQLIM